MGFSQSLSRVLAGGDIIWQKPNITPLAINLEYHNLANFTDMQKYHKLWRTVNSADMLEFWNFTTPKNNSIAG
jgi:hypothetical protein